MIVNIEIFIGRPTLIINLMVSSGIGQLLNSNGEIEHSAHAKAAPLNDYFSSVFSLDNDIISSILLGCLLRLIQSTVMPHVFLHLPQL